jgi:hypothetical protein
VGNTCKISFIVSLGSADFMSSTNVFWLLKKLNSAYGDSLNMNLANRIIALHRGHLFWIM